MVRSARAVAAGMAGVLVTGTALAQPGPPAPPIAPSAAPATAAQKRQAQDLVKQAIARSQAKDHAGAIALYERAYAVVPLPTLLSNIGTEHQAAGQPIEALAYFCRYLEADPAGPLSTFAQAQARVLQDGLGGTDREVCVPAAPAPVDPVAPVPVPVPVALAPLTAVAPRGPLRTEAGSGLRLAGLVAGAVGLVTVGGGVVFGLRARSISDDISSQPLDQPWRDDIADYEAEGERAETLQIVLLATGGALVVGGTVAYLLGRRAAAREQLTVAPIATAHGGGFVVGGRF